VLSSMVLTGGCSSFSGGMKERLSSATSMRSSAPPGTPEWWRKAKQDAELVPGEGYKVAGVPGFFDEHGRPMTAPVSEAALVLERAEEKKQGLFPGLDPKQRYADIKKAVGLGPDQRIAQTALAEGKRLYAAKEYSAAAKEFKQASERWPDSAIEQEALYLEACCYFFNDRYIDARETFVKLMDKHPNSPHMDDAVERMWAIGQYWEQYDQYNPNWALTPNVYDKTRPWFDTRGHAIKTYENIQLYDPTGPRADDAIMATAGIHFRAKRYNDADHYYELLRQEYPRSDFQFEAHLLGLQCKLLMYQGPDYDGSPLIAAQKLDKQLRQQFAGRLSSEERERLSQTRAQVAAAIAQRDMTMAKHYEKTAHYGAAKYYYRELVKNYPESQLATEARTRLAQIADEPDVPEERLAWLIDLFPENPERTRVAQVPEISEKQPRLAENAPAEGSPAADKPFNPLSTR
jgi:outer membrane protein assembly factor BamD (BamD/ComL family)